MKSIIEIFQQEFGGDPDGIGFAPGRVNLIGEHTDYNDGFVFPAAIHLGVRIAAKLNGRNYSRLHSVEAGRGVDFDASDISRNRVEGWCKYPAGVAWAIKNEYRVVPPNLDAVICSDLPMEASLSSSAAVELAFASAWNHILGLGKSPMDLALVCKLAENEYVGVKSGIMDQMASALGEEGKALFIDTRSLECKAVKMPEHLSIVVCDTKTSRELANSAYNERRIQCEEAAQVLQVTSLRDASLPSLEDAKPKMDTILYNRAHHVISENDRCKSYFEALRNSDDQLVSQLMKESHLSLRDDYEVSSPALDAMANAAWQSRGCVGARMTGAGFGGACVALCNTLELQNFLEDIAKNFKNESGLEGSYIVTYASRGSNFHTANIDLQFNKISTKDMSS